MTQKSVKHFNNEYERFSNFYPCEVHFEGRTYPTTEHAFQAAKTIDKMERKKISEAETPSIAKRLGRNVRLRKGWDIIKISIMKRLLTHKFSIDEFKTLLISTDDVVLTEGNYWHDNYWGDCYCKKCKDIKGKNQLGKLLMKIREMIK